MGRLREMTTLTWRWKALCPAVRITFSNGQVQSVCACVRAYMCAVTSIIPPQNWTVIGIRGMAHLTENGYKIE